MLASALPCLLCALSTNPPTNQVHLLGPFARPAETTTTYTNDEGITLRVEPADDWIDGGEMSLQSATGATRWVRRVPWQDLPMTVVIASDESVYVATHTWDGGAGKTKSILRVAARDCFGSTVWTLDFERRYGSYTGSLNAPAVCAITLHEARNLLGLYCHQRDRSETILIERNTVDRNTGELINTQILDYPTTDGDHQFDRRPRIRTIQLFANGDLELVHAVGRRRDGDRYSVGFAAWLVTADNRIIHRVSRPHAYATNLNASELANWWPKDEAAITPRIDENIITFPLPTTDTQLQYRIHATGLSYCVTEVFQEPNAHRTPNPNAP